MGYPCPTCGVVFTQRTGVRRHMNAIHLKEVSYTCDICAKSFFKKALLKLHQRVHSGEKPYQCEDCGKTFPKNSSLKRHMRFHSGTKAYACKLCERTFNEKYNLKAHLQRAHKTNLDDETGVSLTPHKPLIKAENPSTFDVPQIKCEPGTSNTINGYQPPLDGNAYGEDGQFAPESSVAEPEREMMRMMEYPEDSVKAHLQRAHKTNLDDVTGVSLIPDKPLIKAENSSTFDVPAIKCEPGTSNTSNGYQPHLDGNAYGEDGEFAPESSFAEPEREMMRTREYPEDSGKAHLQRAHKTNLDDETGVSLIPDKPLIKAENPSTFDVPEIKCEPGTSNTSNGYQPPLDGNAYGEDGQFAPESSVAEPEREMREYPEYSGNDSMTNLVGHEMTDENGFMAGSEGDSDQDGESKVAEAASKTGVKVEEGDPEEDRTGGVEGDRPAPKKYSRKRDPNCTNHYACRECGKKYLNPSSVYVHMATAHRQRRFACTECPKDFKHKQHLARHLESAHNVDSKREKRPAIVITHACGTCSEVFSNKNALKKHEQTHVQGFKCEYCKVMFPTMEEMLEHVPTHVNDWAHQCTICGERFEKATFLKRHLPSHLNV